MPKILSPTSSLSQFSQFSFLKLIFLQAQKSTLLYLLPKKVQFIPKISTNISIFTIYTNSFISPVALTLILKSQMHVSFSLFIYIVLHFPKRITTVYSQNKQQKIRPTSWHWILHYTQSKDTTVQLWHWSWKLPIHINFPHIHSIFPKEPLELVTPKTTTKDYILISQLWFQCNVL